jgi:hypothetical protein
VPCAVTAAEPLSEESRNRRSQAWRPLLAGAQLHQACSAAIDVAGRLADRRTVRDAVASATARTRFPRALHWTPYGVAQGEAGLAILHGYLDSCKPDGGWDRVAHDELAMAVSAMEQLEYVPTDPFTGVAGLGFAARAASRGGLRYRRLMLQVDAELVNTAAPIADHLLHDDGMPVSRFDLISGAAGLAAYLLPAAGVREADSGLQRLLAALVAITGESRVRPRWFTPASAMADESLSAAYPHGHLNLGLAHGIPGPLAVMALAVRAGVEVPGLAEATLRTARWLADQVVEDPWGISWPTMIGLDSAGTPRPAGDHQAGRTAWCYGAPGVCRALWLAAGALDDDSLREVALAGLRALLRRPPASRGVDSPTFCHGIAGMLQITLRFAHETGDPQLAAAAQGLVDELLAGYSADSLVGFQNLEPGGAGIDQPGLLDGAAGVAAVLMACCTDVEPTWDRLFLLS